MATAGSAVGGVFEGLLEVASSVAKTVGASDVAAGIDAAKNATKDLNAVLNQGAATLEDYRIRLTKASGASSDFADKIREESKTFVDYGVSLEKLVGYNEQIVLSFNKAAFSSVQTREKFDLQRKELQNLIAFNDKFNVSSNQTIDLVNKLGNSVFNTVKEVGKFSDALWKFSRTTGQDFSKVLSEFNSYSDRFIQTYSEANFDKGAQAFGNIELMAKRAGMSVDKLVGSISKFDDIDTAFSSGGQINRVLSYFGGSFDTLAAANASDEERAQMLFKSISDIGERFNQQMTNPAARRAMLKELESATGFSSQQLVGLMNQNKSMAEDLKSLMENPVPLKPEALPEEERKRQMLSVTSSEDVRKIQKELFELGPLTAALEKLQSNMKADALDRGKRFTTELDSVIHQVMDEGNVEGAIKVIGQAGQKFAEYMTGANGPVSQIGNALSSPSFTENLRAAYLKNTQTIEGDLFQKRLDTSVEVLAKAHDKKLEVMNEKAATAIADKMPKVFYQEFGGEVRLTVVTDSLSSSMPLKASSLVSKTTVKPTTKVDMNFTPAH